MKCLEKDRTRRYETANGLATDIHRHLNNEPVLASPPSRLYHFQKLARRNKAAAAATAIVAMVLVLGILVSAWQALRARWAEHQARRAQTNEALERQKAQNAQANETKERQKAQTEAAKSQQVAQFLKDMLRSVGPSKALGRDTTMLREILDNTADRVRKSLTNQPEVETELLITLAGTYKELSSYKKMDELTADALSIAKTRLGAESPAAAEALYMAGSCQWLLGNYDQAETMLKEALSLQRKINGNEHLNVAYVLNNLGNVLWAREQLPQAEAAFREALMITRKVAGEEDPEVVVELANLGGVLESQVRLAEAETALRQALTLKRKLSGTFTQTSAPCS